MKYVITHTLFLSINRKTAVIVQIILLLWLAESELFTLTFLSNHTDFMLADIILFSSMQDIIKAHESVTPLSRNPLEKLWAIPEFSAVRQGWQMPAGLQIGIASRNPIKIVVANRVVQELGGTPVLAGSVSEDAIKQHLQSEWQQNKVYTTGSLATDFFRVSSIAHYKALAAFWGRSDVTHVVGFDTDVYTVGRKNDGPFHTPPDYESYIDTLGKISGQDIEVRIAGSLADMSKRAIVAFEEVLISFRLAKFDPMDFIGVMGTDAIGRIAGGIDYSDERVIPFLDRTFPMWVDRIPRFSQPPHNKNEQLERIVFLNPIKGPALLYDYFKGCPPDLIKWIIYNGIREPMPYLTMHE